MVTGIFPKARERVPVGISTLTRIEGDIEDVARRVRQETACASQNEMLTSANVALDQPFSPASVIIALRSDIKRKIFAVALRRVGISSTLFSNGAALLHALFTDLPVPTMVILELDLPKPGGGHVIQILRTQQQFRRTRIVLHCRESSVPFAHLLTPRRKVDAYLPIPFIESRFLNEVVDYLLPPPLRYGNVNAARVTDRSSE